LRAEGLIANKKLSKYSSKDALKTLEAPSGIILGRVDDELLIIPPESELDNRNVLVVGSSGSAKGQAFVIPNIINNKNETIIVTDPKGELFHLTADIKRDQGYKVYQ
ncbi:type IV secretory system conjugative DNA transfer family protein, partial [Escherichia coli]|nr:type IV secretory system conjugative DNA transfer family protein [Escherichia coli]